MAGEFDNEEQWMKLLETQIADFDTILRQNVEMENRYHEERPENRDSRLL